MCIYKLKINGISIPTSFSCKCNELILMIRKSPDKFFSSQNQASNLWRFCTNLRTLKQIHASMVITGFQSDRYALRELIFASAIVVPSAIQYAHQVFDQIFEPELFIWNTLLRGSAQSTQPSLAISLYAKLETSGIKPDSYTFPFLLKACTRLSRVNTGVAVHGKIVKHGFEGNKFARNTLIYFHANCADISVAKALFDDTAKRDVVAWSAITAGYAKRGQLDIARQLFDEMPVKDLVSWNVMITGYVKQGKMENAKELFKLMPMRDVVSWNTMISGHVLRGEFSQAFEMYEEMRRHGDYFPDEVTMLSLVSACADAGDLDAGEKLHDSILAMEHQGRRISSSITGNALIDMYAKCGSIEKALQVFRSIREKDITSWNSLICGLAFHGYPKKCIEIFEQMRRTKVIPNEITFTGVLVACSHAGEVNAGREYFNLMKTRYCKSIQANIRHYGCMVDMFGRAGLLDEAFEFTVKMEEKEEGTDYKPNAVIWRTLLGACKVHGNMELGKRVNEKLLKLQEDESESGDYVLLSNIYASKGEWIGVEKVRKLMEYNGVRKEAGQSFISAETETETETLLKSCTT